jgi:glycosyltransferase involved in cell wall biosynthesis
MQKLLFVCNDFIGNTMAGPGIRYWEMAHALKRKGHATTLLTRHLEPGFSGDNTVFAGKASLSSLFTWIKRSDWIIQPGSPVALVLSVLLRRKIIFDQYDPVIFEFFERKPASFFGKIQKSFMLMLWRVRQRLILRFGHAFLVANEKQKDLLIGQLAVLGHLYKLDSVIVLPFGLSATKPIKTSPVLRGTKIKDSDFLLVWGGGIWEWFDPLILLHALAKIKQQRDDIKVYFPGLRPPSPESQKLAIVDAFLREAETLGLLGNTVFVNSKWTPYESRADYLLEADVGISLHRESSETRFAFRTRMLDYLWAGLPIIASQGDSWADLIEKNCLGLTVPCGDVESVVKSVLRMADDLAFRKRCRLETARVAGEYSWDNIVSRLKLPSPKP